MDSVNRWHVQETNFLIQSFAERFQFSRTNSRLVRVDCFFFKRRFERFGARGSKIENKKEKNERGRGREQRPRMLNKSEKSAYPTAGCSSCPFRVRATVTNCWRYWFYLLPVSCLREIRPWPSATQRKVADFYLGHASPAINLCLLSREWIRGACGEEWSFCDFYSTWRSIRVDTEGGIIYFGDDGTGHWSCFFVLRSCIDCIKIEGEKE